MLAFLSERVLSLAGIGDGGCRGGDRLALSPLRAYTCAEIDAVAPEAVLDRWRAVVDSANFTTVEGGGESDENNVLGSIDGGMDSSGESGSCSDENLSSGGAATVAGTPRKGVRLEACELTPDTVSWFAAGSVFAQRFLARGNPHLGRKGSVCPFVPKAIMFGTLRVIVFASVDSGGDGGGGVDGERGRHHPGAEPTAADLVRVCRDAAPLLLSLPPQPPSVRATFRALVMLFPGVAAPRAHRVVDAAQRVLKPEFVSRGLMIGEFHAGNNTHGLHSDSFFPLRCPVPALAVRSMVRSDIVFMETEGQVRAYESLFGKVGGGSGGE